MDLTPDLSVRIDELVLDGFAPGDRYRISEAVERELARLLLERSPSSPAGWTGDVGQIDGGSFELDLLRGPSAIGRRIAEAVHGGLVR